LNGDQENLGKDIKDKMISLIQKINKNQNEIELLEHEINDD
jgi:hypothetical protein